MPNPQFPIYIPSKGRAESRLTVRALERMKVPFRVIVEEQQYRDYAAVIDAQKLLILDKSYQRDYDALVELRASEGKGSGPARNFAWDHAVAAGFERHWVIDDNIRVFYRLNHNVKISVGDGAIFRVMEDFVLRYKNVAMAGPNYQYFAKQRQALPPFVANTRIFSCNLIRNDTPLRWRGRYNEDVDLSLRMLKAGWCTVLFNAFLQDKITTQSMPGGNTDEFYAKEGTLPKSKMIVKLHPDVARLTWRFGRAHHYVDYTPFRRTKLIRRDDFEMPTMPNEYGMRLRTGLR
jgi:hypothetical protein